MAKNTHNKIWFLYYNIETPTLIPDTLTVAKCCKCLYILYVRVFVQSAHQGHMIFSLLLIGNKSPLRPTLLFNKKLLISLQVHYASCKVIMKLILNVCFFFPVGSDITALGAITPHCNKANIFCRVSLCNIVKPQSVRGNDECCDSVPCYLNQIELLANNTWCQCFSGCRWNINSHPTVSSRCLQQNKCVQ